MGFPRQVLRNDTQTDMLMPTLVELTKGVVHQG